MKKLGKIILITFATLLLLSKGVEWFLEDNFLKTLNGNPERSYNITYDGFDLHPFFTGITLDEVRIEPLKRDSGTVINGKVDYATINGFVWLDLLFRKNLHVDEIAFIKPTFEITIGSGTSKKTNDKRVQDLFQDILTRGDLSNFRIENGSIVLKEPITGNVKGRISNIDIEAVNLQTDSVQLKHIIPFKMDNLKIAIDSLEFNLDGNMLYRLGTVRYDLKEKDLVLRDLSLKFTKDWVKMSQDIGVQKDLIELELKMLSILEVEPSSSFFSELDIVAEKVVVEELQIAFRKNKNYKRPPDKYKPMFLGMINSIPTDLSIDSILIKNSKITYSELGVDKSKSGSIEITDVNASLFGVTNIPERQVNLEKATLKAEAKLAGKGNIDIMLSIPYDKNEFSLAVNIGPMDMTDLNPTLKPLAGVEILSAKMKKIQYHIKASETRANNTLVFDYENLDLNIISEKGEAKGKRRAFLSAVANAAVRSDNLPDQEKYLTASYQTKRNIYRSPIVFCIKSIAEGVTYIVPSKGVQKFLHKKKK